MNKVTEIMNQPKNNGWAGTYGVTNIERTFMNNLNTPNSNLSSNRDFKIHKIGNEPKNGHFDPIKNTLSIKNTRKTTSNRQIPIFCFLCRHPEISINYDVSSFRAVSSNYFGHSANLRNSVNALVVNYRQKIRENKEGEQFTITKQSEIINQKKHILNLLNLVVSISIEIPLKILALYESAQFSIIFKTIRIRPDRKVLRGENDRSEMRLNDTLIEFLYEMTTRWTFKEFYKDRTGQR